MVRMGTLQILENTFSKNSPVCVKKNSQNNSTWLQMTIASTGTISIHRKKSWLGISYIFAALAGDTQFLTFRTIGHFEITNFQRAQFKVR